jgi:peptide/nickel transport system substrate-binding protein
MKRKGGNMMTRSGKKFFLLILGAILVVTFAGVASAAPQKGGTMVIITNQTPRHLVGAVQSGAATAQASTQIFAALVRFDKDWNPHPYLAESWKFSNDGLSVTFKLRKDAKFHDGKPITSEDVAFSAMTVKANHPFKPMMAPVEKVETPDPYTAIFRLSKPHPALLLSLSAPLCPIIPKHIFGDGQDPKTHPMNLKPVGSGPFKFVEYKPSEYLILERNENFFIQDRPYLDKIIFKYVQDPSNRRVMMERGDGNVFTFSQDSQDVKRLRKKANLKMTKEGYYAIGPITWVAFNVRNKPLSDVRVRKAIAYAIDRKFIVEKIQSGLSTPATGPIVPYSPYYSANVENYDLDLKKANALLNEAGFPKGKDGNRFSLSVDYMPGNNEQERFPAEYMKSQLKKIGIDIQVRSSADFPSWAKRVANWDFEITMDNVWNWGDPVIGVERTFMCNNARKGVIWSNTQGYCNPKVDEILEKAGKEMDMNKRKALYGEFQKIVADEVPIYWINVAPYHTIYDKKVKNLNQSIWGVMAPSDEVYIEK